MSSASVLFSIGTNSCMWNTRVASTIKKETHTHTHTKALIGWVLLALAPNWKYTYPATRTIVLASCVNYLVNMAKGSRLPPYLATLKGEAKPGFSSLPAVLTLLRKSNDETLLGAWVHYLAFDLLVGEFITRDAAAVIYEDRSHPC